MQGIVVELVVLQVGYQLLKGHEHGEVGLKEGESQGSLIG